MRHVPFSYAGPQEFAVVVYGYGDEMRFVRIMVSLVGTKGGLSLRYLECCPFIAVQTDYLQEAEFVCSHLLAQDVVVSIVRRAFGGAISAHLLLPCASTVRLPRPHATLC